jgi:LacI family transcriptional regulator
MLHRIFVSRGICGALGVGMMRHNSLSARFQKIWENYPCVVAGVRTCDPALSFACVDHHDLARQAVTNVLRLGYRRPALMLDAKIDALIDGRFSAGFYIAQRHLMSSMRVVPFYIKGRSHIQSKGYCAEALFVVFGRQKAFFPKGTWRP